MAGPVKPLTLPANQAGQAPRAGKGRSAAPPSLESGRSRGERSWEPTFSGSARDHAGQLGRMHTRRSVCVRPVQSGICEASLHPDELQTWGPRAFEQAGPTRTRTSPHFCGLRASLRPGSPGDRLGQHGAASPVAFRERSRRSPQAGPDASRSAPLVRVGFTAPKRPPNHDARAPISNARTPNRAPRDTAFAATSAA